MDASKIYIKMSDCPEIQGQWKPKMMDITDDGFVVDANTKKGKTAITAIGKYGEQVFCFMEDCVWLPRQDQIQEMLNIKTVHDFRNVVDEIFYERDGGLYDKWDEDWLWSTGDIIFESMEQFWLAFYMWKKHKKFWNGEKWSASK